jgi:maltose alpha-D-glucosyltransferase/alpha-amylase
VIYEVGVRSFFDSNGDGIGDLPGLAARLDHIAGLGATCLWLLPIYPSPWRDDGYDISDYYGIHPDLGTLGDFSQMVHRADDRGLRVIIDLVLNHTSDRHPWFRAAREGHPRYRDYYVWSKSRPPDAQKGVVFPGVQKTTWTFDREARQYYFHRFYDFQPDLNFANPQVREEMERIIGFWLRLGIAGFRMDAVPFLIEPAGPLDQHPEPRFDLLRQLSGFTSWRRGDAVLLAEANVDRHALKDYYERGGLSMLFNFDANRNLWLALATGDATPLLESLRRTAGIPTTDQWANFLRNHDELDLGTLTARQRAVALAAFGPDPGMQLYGRGVRRRVASMLGNDRARIELAFSLMLTLPGTPVVYYGDEIGMGEDLSLHEREPVRTAMQWSGRRAGGFSSARDIAVPVISDGPFGFRKVNVLDQSTDDDSLLNWLQHAIRTRAACPEFGTGPWEPVSRTGQGVMALRYANGDRDRDGDGDGSRYLLAVHNLTPEPRRIPFRVLRAGRGPLTILLADRTGEGGARATGRLDADLELSGYGYRWLRGGSDL